MSSRIQPEDDKEKLKVCVVGAGAAGLCAIRHLTARHENFDLEVFEKTDCIGGTWVYVHQTESVTDGGRRKIHSSMYQNLRSVKLRTVMMMALCEKDF